MKKLEDLKPGDYIAFPYQYMGGEPKEIMVSNITFKHNEGFIVHFMVGHRSESEYIPLKDILAIGNLESGKTKIRGWVGKFDAIQPEHPLMIKFQEKIKEKIS